MSARHLAMLGALSAIWGASFLFIKVGVRELEPGALIMIRIGLGAVTLLAIVAARTPLREATRSLRAYAWPLLVMGVLNSALPFWLITWAEQDIDSGLTAVLQASAPLFTALLAIRFSHDQRVRGARLVGVLVGFVGVALLVGAPGGGEVVASIAVVASALCYSAAVLYGGRRLRGLPPLLNAAGSMVAATLVTFPLGIAELPHGAPGWKVTASVVTLGVLGTGVAYVLYFALIAGAGASRAILVTYLVPALALLYGALILDEGVTVGELAGLVLVIGGVALGTGARVVRRRAAVPG